MDEHEYFDFVGINPSLIQLALKEWCEPCRDGARPNCTLLSMTFEFIVLCVCVIKY